MSLLVVQDVSKSFGIDTVLSGVCFRLSWGQKIGLVGRNGSGKTTLLRILSGQMESDGNGRVLYARGVRFGYLRQEQMVEQGRTVYEEAQDAFAPVLAMEQRLRELEQAMASSEDDARLQAVMDEYSLMRDRFEAMGGYENLRDIRKVLQRLGFSAEDMDKPTARLSAPDVLLLDEPTNHLDLQATEWLEDFLHDFGGAVILVSHDRYFLDRVVTTIAELDGAQLTLYHGNFSAYWMQKQERRARQAEQRERERREIQRLTEFFEKWKNTPSKRSQAVMRLRWAERIRARMTDFPQSAGKSMHLKVQAKMRSGEEVVVVDRLTKRFGERTLMEEVNLLIRRGQRIGIVGPNGAGKSTFIKMLLGREQPTSGSIRLGANVTVGYFAQETSDLDLEATVIENMMDVAEMIPEEARTYLGRFLFTGDDVFRKVADLSGGEKNKLALAQLTYLRPNLLILDEPTNHLDIDSREALTEMLKRYDGTLLLVSHDRYLLDQVTDFTLEITGGRVTLYEGPYHVYRQIKAEEEAKDGPGGKARFAQRLTPNALQREHGARASGSVLTPNAPNPLTAGMNSYQLSKERQKAAKNVAQMERRVTEVEDWLKRIEETLSAPMPGDDVVKLARDYQQAQDELAAAMQAWEEAVAYAEGIGAAI